MYIHWKLVLPMAWSMLFIAAFCALTNAPNLIHAPRLRLVRMQCHAFRAAYFGLSKLLLLYDLPLQLLVSNYIQQIVLLFKSGESPVVGA